MERRSEARKALRSSSTAPSKRSTLPSKVQRTPSTEGEQSFRVALEVARQHLGGLGGHRAHERLQGLRGTLGLERLDELRLARGEPVQQLPGGLRVGPEQLAAVGQQEEELAAERSPVPS
jgi:hypothetical protein